MKNIDITENAETRDIAAWIESRIRSALAETDGTITLSVPGGSTPFPIFESLAKQPLDWPRVEIMPGDDRIVPEDHAASNTGKIRALFEPAGAKVTALSDVEKPPHFALVWLGMGGDGHIASLFPNTDPAADDPQPLRRLTPDPLPPEAPFDRITLTIPALLNSDELLFTLGANAEKRGVFEAAMKGENDLPVARLLSAASQPVQCFT